MYQHCISVRIKEETGKATIEVALGSTFREKSGF
jgi:hypothetical protein